MGEEDKILKKPNLVNLHMKQTTRHIFIGLTLATIVGAIYKIVFYNPKKYKYELYYKLRDADETFERMQKAGVFQSCPLEEKKSDDKK